ncbi:MAG TPA: metallopeptidase TldD-related protein [Anaerolineales bacterium]|jgi:PmbA protein|nr:metallopeptidase TldD-related protein [Anaerolineales bacterium]
MLSKLLKALKDRADLAAWSVRHITKRAAQTYAVPHQMEAARRVAEEEYKIEILRHTKTVDGSDAVGSGRATLLPGGDIDAAIDRAALIAGLMTNPVHSIPAPARIPELELVDPRIANHMQHSLGEVMSELRSAASKNNGVRLTSAECFGEIQTVHLINSRGIDAQQEATQIDIEYVLQAHKGERHSEMQRALTSRRAADLNIDADVGRRARYTIDVLEATAPSKWQGPVVLRDDALANFMAGDDLYPGILKSLGSAASKYAKISPWEIGKSVFREDVKGDPLTAWANRAVPLGSESNGFDDEGLPAQRVELIRDNKLVAFVASQRYADYLHIPPTGDFGAVELPPGRTPAANLLSEPYVEISQFSWFNPDPITGNFATEIRLGYLVSNGTPKPFKGGQLIGNVLDALADVRWSAETGYFGPYLGPHTARFNDLKVA